MKTLGQIAKYLDGELRGNADIAITRVVHPALVRGPEDLALVLSGNVLELLKQNQVTNAVAPAELGPIDVPNFVLVPRPRLALARLLELFERPAYSIEGIHPSAVIDPTAKIGANTSIGPNCWIGPNTVIGTGCRLVSNVSIGADVKIGNQTLVHAGVFIGDRCEIGDHVIIQPNATIGADGFSFVTPERGSVESVRPNKKTEVTSFNHEIVRVNSIGNVVIEDHVEIGAGTCIDRGTLGETRIGSGTKLDNLIQVGHNASIGRNCLIVALSGLGGSSKVGDRVVMGGQSGLPDHMTVGDDAVIWAQAGVVGNVPAKQAVGSTPAVPMRDFLEREVQLKRLPTMQRQLKELQQAVADLQKKLGQG
ncbi:MAG: UDP-3-O-(3-hydroxymyristoyl)glucosamine N-acyltransferase [Verrucomicrobia bacterium]|nr:UDP-3-O-(3-hydroxymyristoyl)glucosamine N-acyltransferase [Verrucomicrobiota bacterium]